MIEGPFKERSFQVLRRVGVIAVAEAFAKGIPILAYHGVTETPDGSLRNLRRLHVRRDHFEAHLRFLRTQRDPIPLSAVWEAVEMRRPLPGRSVIVTIDDGYRNIVTVALPLLRRFDVPATVFVLTDGERERRMWIDRLEAAIEATTASSLRWEGQSFPLNSVVARAKAMLVLVSMFQGLGVERQSALERLLVLLGHPSEESDPDRDLLGWGEIRALHDAGLEIGSHADCHEPLTERPFEEVGSALAKSREMLERQLGPGRYALSYPYGAWNLELAGVAKQAGFACAVTGDPGLNRFGVNLFGLKRLLVGADDDISRLRASLSGLRSFWRQARSYPVA